MGKYMRIGKKAFGSNGDGDSKPIKVITGHTGLARFMVELGEEPIGEVKRQYGIPSPYAQSSVDTVWDWKGTPIFIRETSHNRYEVFKVPKDITIHPSGD